MNAFIWQKMLDSKVVDRQDSLDVVVAHMMPDLPNMGMERDLNGFIEFFENPAFRSDGLKLYPTLVIRGLSLSFFCL